MTTHGMLLGKFLPPHLGHRYLVEFALGFADRLTVLVCTLEDEPIPGHLRHAWMDELFGSRARVVHVAEEVPQDPSEHPHFWDIWRDLVTRHTDAPIDLVFASEDYGVRLAAEVGADFVPVDLARDQVRVSGTAVRADPLGHWDLIPAPVRAYYARRVSVFGPESTGKSTLTRALATHYRTRHVDEYARAHLDYAAAPLTDTDFVRIALGQAAAEDALARQCDRLLVCDTDPLATTLWAQTLLGRCPERVDAIARARRYDLTLLCDVDVPFVPDPHRYQPDQADRDAFFARCQAALAQAGRRVVTLRGSWEQRLALATSSIDAMLRDPRE